MAPERGLHWFERDYRHLLEAEYAFAELDGDGGSLGFGPETKQSFLSALQAMHHEPHWCGDAANYPTIDDLALQLIVTAANSLRPDGRTSGTPFDACVRVVRSPMVSPYVLSARGIIVVPRGFLASVDAFVSTVCELSYVGARLHDHSATLAHWDLYRIVMAQSRLITDHPNEYAFGAFVALQPTFFAFAIADSPDFLRAAVFNKNLYPGLNEMMPTSHRLEALGFGSLGSILPLEPQLLRTATDLRRLVACVALCHEMGHLLVDEASRAAENVPGHVALGHEGNERLADGFGIGIFYRMKEAGLLTLLLEGRAVTHGAFINALAAFNAWSFAVCIVRVSVAQFEKNERAKREAMAALVQVAGRWKRNADMLIQAEGGHADEGKTLGLAETVFPSWSFPCSELLRQLFLSIRLRIDDDQAYQALYSLDDPDSEVCRHIAAATFD